MFDILGWSLSENGSIALLDTTHEWLRTSTDSRKLNIALHLEAYPFKDPLEMERVLTDLAKRSPEVAGRCHELIEQRRKEEKR